MASLPVLLKRASTVKLEFNNQVAACVVASSRGYPGKVEDGKVISGLDAVDCACQVFHAGTKFDASNNVISSGGRILTVAALGDNLSQALSRVYQGLSKISFDGMHHRKDIGK